MRQHYVLFRTTEAGEKVFLTRHWKSTDSYTGVDVETDKNLRKALLFGSLKNAEERAKELSSDLEIYAVEPCVSDAKVGDVVAESDEGKAKLAEKAS